MGAFGAIRRESANERVISAALAILSSFFHRAVHSVCGTRLDAEDRSVVEGERPRIWQEQGPLLGAAGRGPGGPGKSAERSQSAIATKPLA